MPSRVIQAVIASTLLLLLCTCSLSAQDTFGKFELYIPADYDTFNEVWLGRMTGKTSGTLNLKTGGKEPATFEVYSFNQDSIPDLYIIRRENGRIVSLGLDTTSSQYKLIKATLSDKILPWEEKDSTSAEGLTL
jgi:hypothetical protein